MTVNSTAARLGSLIKILGRQQILRTMSSSKATSLAKPADTLKDSKVLSKEELKEPKWVSLEGIKWRNAGGQEVRSVYGERASADGSHLCVTERYVIAIHKRM